MRQNVENFAGYRNWDCVRLAFLIDSWYMHDNGSIFPVLGLVDGKDSGGIKTKLFADSLAIDISEGILQYAVLVPVAPDSMAFIFLFGRIKVPEALACKNSAFGISV